MSLLIFIVLGTIPSVFLSEVSTSSEDSFSVADLQFSEVSWNSSDYTNFTGPPIKVDPSVEWHFRIFIDDNDPNYNWSITALNNSWLTGSGTYLDPYIIEDFYINSQGFGGMIFVKNSDKFFIIRNNWFNFSGPNEHDVGVLLQFSTNGLIVNNSFTYTHKGVTMESFVSNITVDNNIFISDHTTAGGGRALDIDGQNYNITVSNNKIRDYYSGIGMANSVNLIIRDNYIENGIWENHDGTPVFCVGINDTQIIRNTLAGSFSFSSFVIIQSGGQGNIILNNTVTAGEPLTFGPETADIGANAPKLSQDSSRLMLIEDSYNNLIAHNVMIGGSEEGSGEGGTILGFDIFILMGMFGIISVLLVVIKRKKR